MLLNKCWTAIKPVKIVFNARLHIADRYYCMITYITVLNILDRTGLSMRQFSVDLDYKRCQHSCSSFSSSDASNWPISVFFKGMVELHKFTRSHPQRGCGSITPPLIKFWKSHLRVGEFSAFWLLNKALWCTQFLFW